MSEIPGLKLNRNAAVQATIQRTANQEIFDSWLFRVAELFSPFTLGSAAIPLLHQRLSSPITANLLDSLESKANPPTRIVPHNTPRPTTARTLLKNRHHPFYSQRLFFIHH